MTSSPGIPTVDVHEASVRASDGRPAALIVDVREADEFAAVRVEAAAHLPMSGFVTRAAELPRDRPLLILCATGSRSAAVTGYLLRSGWTDVTNIDGGITAWQRGGLPVRRGPVTPGEGALPAD
jgi:rhodanese-related sulfurtransferase